MGQSVPRSVRQETIDIFHGHIDELIDLDAKLCGANELLLKSTDNLSWTCGGAWKTYTPTLTGWSSNPAIDLAHYSQVGKTVTLKIKLGLTNTSNTTAMRVTLPVMAADSNGGFDDHHMAGRVYDNGAFQASSGMVIVRANSVNADIFTGGSGGSWTASGAKAVSFTITYEAQ